MDLTTVDTIQSQIHLIRNRKVMLDSDLAKLYKVSTGNLNLAVRRHINRFPSDFMFQLTNEETDNLLLQSARSSLWGGRRLLPYVFTQEGVAMLSGILNSTKAVEVNIAIMRAFIRMQHILTSDSQLGEKLRELENKLVAHDYQIEDILKAIQKLMQGPRKHKPRIGYL